MEGSFGLEEELNSSAKELRESFEGLARGFGDFLGGLEERFLEEFLEVFLETVFLERRETSPSIDLFFSIVYNYNIWR